MGDCDANGCYIGHTEDMSGSAGLATLSAGGTTQQILFRVYPCGYDCWVEADGGDYLESGTDEVTFDAAPGQDMGIVVARPNMASAGYEQPQVTLLGGPYSGVSLAPNVVCDEDDASDCWSEGTRLEFKAPSTPGTYLIRLSNWAEGQNYDDWSYMTVEQRLLIRVR